MKRRGSTRGAVQVKAPVGAAVQQHRERGHLSLDGGGNPTARLLQGPHFDSVSDELAQVALESPCFE